MKQLRYHNRLFTHWVIDGEGEVSCTLDPTFAAAVRTVGKRKKYRQVQIMNYGRLQWYYTHRLMGFSWLPRPKNKKLRIVDHKNGNSLDNRVENLRWITERGNNLNRACYGLVKHGNLFVPKIASFEHRRYASTDEATALMLRKTLVDCYVKFTIKYPDSGDYPHEKITNYK